MLSMIRINEFVKLKRSTMFAMLLLISASFLAMPASSFAASGVINKLGKPWIAQDGQSRVPFDGNVGAFNKNVAEGVNFTCTVNQQVKGKINDLYKIAAAQGPGYPGGVKAALRYIKNNPKNADVKSYIYVMDDVDAAKAKANKAIGACDENPVKVAGPGLTDILNPTQFFIKLIGSIITAPFVLIINLVGPGVFAVTFVTPHTERGDTIFNSHSDRCGNAPCGFNKDLVNDNSGKQDNNFWIKMSLMLRSLLSATYGAIIIGIALIYMYRQNVTSAYNIKKVLPRVFASVALMAMFPFIIGIIISLSNYLVQGILGTGLDLNSVGSSGFNGLVNYITHWDNSFDIKSSDIGVLGEYLANAILLIFVSIFMLILFFLAIVKQFALIFVIISAPIACLAFVTEKWARMTQWWFRCIVGIALIPIIQVLIFKVGYELIYTMIGAPPPQ